jgi:hypothetical protein
MHLKRLHYFVALIILAALVALVACLPPRPDASGIGFGFIAYTNSPSGSQNALFGVTNFNKLPIQRPPPGRKDSQASPYINHPVVVAEVSAGGSWLKSGASLLQTQGGEQRWRNRLCCLQRF